MQNTGEDGIREKPSWLGKKLICIFEMSIEIKRYQREMEVIKNEEVNLAVYFYTYILDWKLQISMVRKAVFFVREIKLFFSYILRTPLSEFINLFVILRE